MLVQAVSNTSVDRQKKKCCFVQYKQKDGINIDMGKLINISEQKERKKDGLKKLAAEYWYKIYRKNKMRISARNKKRGRKLLEEKIATMQSHHSVIY